MKENIYHLRYKVIQSNSEAQIQKFVKIVVAERLIIYISL